MINILTGTVHSGKTTLLKKTIPLLREKNFRVTGYLSEAIWKNEKFLRYDLFDLISHKHHPFILKQGRQDWEKIGPFFFQPETLDLAKKIIQRSSKEDLCIVDEVGPLELSGKGVWPVLEDILTFSHLQLLLVVRDSIVVKVLDKIQRGYVVVHKIEQIKTPPQMAESIVQNMEKRRRQDSK